MDYLKRVIADLTMYPMSLYESGESTVNISLEALFDNPRTNMGAPLNGEIFHYRDRYGLEADIVLHLEDGRYALIECKLGSAEIEDGAGHLKELVGLIRKHNEEEKQVPLREPDLLIVITGGEYAYTRPDGVHVIPLACLKG